MTFSDQLAEAVADKMAERRSEWWTFWRRVGVGVGVLAAAVTAIDAARGLWP